MNGAGLGDIIIVRPTGEWKNPSSPFNRPIRNVQVQQAWSNGVLGGVRDFIYTNNFAVDPRPNGGVPAISLQLPAGTVIDLLNALMTAADQIMWVAAYVPVGKSARFPKWDLTIDLRDGERLTGYTGSYPIKQK